jgi:putative Mg2+ transporter-C (MgtC) family protein
MDWLLANWRTLLTPPWAHVAITLAAVVGGGIVGSEREKREKPAGLRTLALVCLGSATFTMVSFAFGTSTGDTGRVAAQIVTGIGFLGAGVILHGRTAVVGLTTAATIWAVAATGIVVGVGYIGPGIALCVLIRCVLTWLAWWEQHWLSELQGTSLEILVDTDHGKTHFHLDRLIEQFHASCAFEPMEQQTGSPRWFRANFRLPRRQRVEFLDALASLPAVREIRQVARDN